MRREWTAITGALIGRSRTVYLLIALRERREGTRTWRDLEGGRALPLTRRSTRLRTSLIASEVKRNMFPVAFYSRRKSNWQVFSTPTERINVVDNFDSPLLWSTARSPALLLSRMLAWPTEGSRLGGYPLSLYVQALSLPEKRRKSWGDRSPNSKIHSPWRAEKGSQKSAILNSLSCDWSRNWGNTWENENVSAINHICYRNSPTVFSPSTSLSCFLCFRTENFVDVFERLSQNVAVCS